MRNYPPRQVVFLTGATGVLGRALLQALSAFDVIALVHKTPLHDPGVTCLTGDVTRPRFGLGNEEYRHLTRCVAYVVHAAAITDFSEPAEWLMHTNLEGTKHALTLASDAGVPIYYVSTAFVHPCKYADGSPGSNAYEDSKCQAEDLVRASRLLATILRPSIILGNSITGVIESFQGFHVTSGMILTGKLPILPVLPYSYIDVIPQDHVANIIAMFLRQGVTGGEYFLTAGEQALRFHALVDIIVSQALRLAGQTSPTPRKVSPELFERLIKPVFMTALPDHTQRRLNRIMLMARYMNLQEPLPSSLPELIRAYGIPPLPDLPSTVVRNLEYWAAHNLARSTTETRT